LPPPPKAYKPTNPYSLFQIKFTPLIPQAQADLSELRSLADQLKEGESSVQELGSKIDATSVAFDELTGKIAAELADESQLKNALVEVESQLNIPPVDQMTKKQVGRLQSELLPALRREVAELNEKAGIARRFVENKDAAAIDGLIGRVEELEAQVLGKGKEMAFEEWKAVR
jgi:hypothetical protein